MTTTVLQLAISLAFFFLLVSALCSALQELLANWLNLRATTMEDAFKKLLDDSNATKLYDHVLVKGMWKDGRKPSYLTPETFSRVLLDLHKVGGLSGTAKQIVDTLAPTALTDIEAHRAAIEKWFDDAMGRVSGWYKRKTHVLVWAIAIVVCLFLNADLFMLGKLFWNDEALRGSMVAAATKYVQENDKGKTDQTQTGSSSGNKGLNGADAGAPKNKSQSQPGSSPGAGGDAKGAGQNANGATKTDGAGATGDGTSGKGSSNGEEVFDKVKKIRAELAGTGVPIGWCWLEDPKDPKDPKSVKCWPNITSPVNSGVDAQKKKGETAPAPGGDSAQQEGAQKEGAADKTTPVNKVEEETKRVREEAVTQEPRLLPTEIGGWIIKFLGILMTALAVSQGSPFWFDLLSKATNVRLAGTKPEEKK